MMKPSLALVLLACAAATSCATSTPDEVVCLGNEVPNADETECIPCTGGRTAVDGECVCPGGQVFQNGQCIPDTDPCAGVDCNDDKECTTDTCDGGVCTNTPVTDGTQCMDGTEAGACVSGACETDPCSVVDCDDENDCTEDTCEAGVCSNANKAEDTSCGAGGALFCNGAGMCVGCNRTEQCPDDGNDCTSTACSEETSNCETSNKTNGFACDFSGGPGICTNGTCGAAPCDLSPCQGGTDCTTASCPDGAAECSEEPVGAGDGRGCDAETDVCDGAGTCVDCVVTNDCPDPGVCKVVECQGNACVISDQADGTLCENGTGVCLGGTCGTVFPCTEDGIRQAIEKAASPNFPNVPLTFDCPEGGEPVNTDATIEIPNSVILDGQDRLTINGRLQHNVVHTTGGDRIELRNLTIEMGQGTTLSGAGIRHQSGDLLKLTNVTVKDSQADDNGGGIIIKPGSTLEANRVIVKDNKAGGEGGGIYNQGTLNNAGCASVSSLDDPCLELHKNEAGRAGGGLRVSNGASALLEVALIHENKAKRTLTSTVGYGGGVFVATGGSVTLTESTVDLNVADRFGGGLYNNGTLTINGTTVSNNTAIDHQGGGLRNLGTFTCFNSTIADNRAPAESGGGFFNAGSAEIIGCTIRGNTASNGDAYRNASQDTLSIVASILTGDCTYADGTPQVRQNYTLNTDITCGNNYVNDSTSGNGNARTTGFSNDDGELTDNGGATLTMLPPPAAKGWINPTDDPFYTSADPSPLPICSIAEAKVDQRGQPRSQGGPCDAGSVEEP